MDLPSYCFVTMASVARYVTSESPSEETLSGLVESALETLRLWLPGKVLGLYVERQLNEPAMAKTSPWFAEVPTGEYSLELRFASWLTVLDAPRVQRVPTYLLPWLPIPKALVVPLFVNDCHRGAIVVEVSLLSRSEVEKISKLAEDISDTLREFEQSSPQGVDSVRGRFAYSMRRIKSATQP